MLQQQLLQKLIATKTIATKTNCRKNKIDKAIDKAIDTTTGMRYFMIQYEA